MFYLTGILTIVFVVLKLVGVIAWSWWLVLLPSLLYCAGWLALVGGAAALVWWAKRSER